MVFSGNIDSEEEKCKKEINGTSQKSHFSKPREVKQVYLCRISESHTHTHKSEGRRRKKVYGLFMIHFFVFK